MIESNCQVRIVSSRCRLVAGVLALIGWKAIWADCVSDLASRVVIPQTDWVVVTKEYRCAAFGNGTTTISAVNAKTKKEVEIAFIDDVEYIELSSSSNSEVSIKLPNFVDLIRQRNDFEGIRLRYEFFPKDDPKARKEYQFWFHHPNDPHAVEWSEKNLKNGLGAVPALQPSGSPSQKPHEPT